MRIFKAGISLSALNFPKNFSCFIEFHPNFVNFCNNFVKNPKVLEKKCRYIECGIKKAKLKGKNSGALT